MAKMTFAVKERGEPMRLIDADALIERWTANGDYENGIYDGAFIIKT